MRIVEIEVMLHHFCTPGPFPSNAPAYQEAHKRLIDDGLIEETLHSRVNFEHATDLIEGRDYRVTEKGRVYVGALKSVPVPVQAWTMSKPTKEGS